MSLSPLETFEMSTMWHRPGQMNYMNFLIKFHKNPVSIVCVYVLECRVNPIFIDEESEDLRKKCSLEKTYLNYQKLKWTLKETEFIFYSTLSFGQ